MYKNDSVMDSGYFVGGNPHGLLYFPPKLDDNDDNEPVLITWCELLDDDKEKSDKENENLNDNKSF